ncbi:hypothetical protein GCM10009839_87630 [Catenulispora yoronensis]|uniref:Uncharacterized protein n=1 Tax=Catenulispora yoronensis TaxID=450799 RepID=A0ABP5H1S5_9ACTN
MVQDGEYRKLIRRFPPSSLLPRIAAAAAVYCRPGEQHPWLNSPGRKYTPWALADAARVSLVHGNEYRSRQAGDQDLFTILNAYSQLDDPFRTAQDPVEHRLRFLLRMAGQQLIWQEFQRNDLARSAAMLVHTASVKPMQHLNNGWDTAMYGCSLTEYVGITQLLWSVILDHAGWFDPRLLPSVEQFAADPRLEQFTSAYLDPEITLQVIEKHFAASSAWLKDNDRLVNARVRRGSGYDLQLRRFEYNPLRARPMVTGLGPGYLCPAPDLVWEKATPWGIMLSGREHFGNAFPADVGHLFEQYIGRQLRLLPGAAVHGEIKYPGPGGTCESADWMVVFDDLVLVIEAKSILPTQPMRLGELDALSDITEKLARAHQQIDTTVDLIRRRHPSFSAIPADRMILGMTATLQPFHIANSLDHRQLLPATTVPVSIASAAEIETLVMLDVASIPQFLIDLAADAERSTWALSTVMADLPYRANPILDQAWMSYPWSGLAADLD